MSVRCLAVWFALAAAACSEPERTAPDAIEPAAADEEAYSMPRPDLLWPMDFSDERVAELSVEELWQIGAAHLNWPADMPAGTTKADVLDRLREARLHEVGIPLGYTD